MGRPTKGEYRLSNEPALWSEGELPQSPPKMNGPNFRSLRYPVWTQNKARLIQAYLQLFLFITKHGTYIDGFAGPQDASHPDLWSAKLVMEMTPKWLRNFWLCDIKATAIDKLKALQAEHVSSQRRIDILQGDFNDRICDILQSGQITEKTATFALLDQRTFECEWRTVEALSSHKTGNKIEIFYFFPTGWIDRSLAAASRAQTKEKILRWWGRADWGDLRGLDGTKRAFLVAERFEKELGYQKANVYSIHSAARGGRVMYHMIHASDHPEAYPLMVRAYRKVSGRPDLASQAEQLDLEALLRNLQNDET